MAAIIILLNSVDKYPILEEKSRGGQHSLEAIATHMNCQPNTGQTIDSFVRKAFDRVYQDDGGNGEVAVGEVVDAIESAHSAGTVKRMLESTGADSVTEMVLMYLDGRTQTEI